VVDVAHVTHHTLEMAAGAHHELHQLQRTLAGEARRVAAPPPSAVRRAQTGSPPGAAAVQDALTSLVVASQRGLHVLLLSAGAPGAPAGPDMPRMLFSAHDTPLLAAAAVAQARAAHAAAAASEHADDAQPALQLLATLDALSMPPALVRSMLVDPAVKAAVGAAVAGRPLPPLVALAAHGHLRAARSWLARAAAAATATVPRSLPPASPLSAASLQQLHHPPPPLPPPPPPPGEALLESAHAAVAYLAAHLASLGRDPATIGGALTLLEATLVPAAIAACACGHALEAGSAATGASLSSLLTPLSSSQASLQPHARFARPLTLLPLAYASRVLGAHRDVRAETVAVGVGANDLSPPLPPYATTPSLLLEVGHLVAALVGLPPAPSQLHRWQQSQPQQLHPRRGTAADALAARARMLLLVDAAAALLPQLAYAVWTGVPARAKQPVPPQPAATADESPLFPPCVHPLPEAAVKALTRVCLLAASLLSCASCGGLPDAMCRSLGKALQYGLLLAAGAPPSRADRASEALLSWDHARLCDWALGHVAALSPLLQGGPALATAELLGDGVTYPLTLCLRPPSAAAGGGGGGGGGAAAVDDAHAMVDAAFRLPPALQQTWAAVAAAVAAAAPGPLVSSSAGSLPPCDTLQGCLELL
jgi:hypothetical protein